MPVHALLTLGVVLAAGLAAGIGAKRLRLPSVTGQILAGILLGPSVFGIFTSAHAHALRPVLDFALALMAVAVGSQLRLRRLANAGRRLGLLAAFEMLITPALVAGVLLAPGLVPWPAAILLAAICVSTAPATILALVSEARARGVFVKTLLAGVALNNLACMVLFEIARAITRAHMDPEVVSGGVAILWAPLRQLGLAVALGVGVGAALVGVTRRVLRPDRMAALSLVAILFVAGVAAWIGVSPLLAGLFLGVTLANLTPSKEEIGHVVFAEFEYAIFAVFFTVAGTELSFEHALGGGLIAALVFSARFAGKFAAASLAMRMGRAIDPLRRYLGLALIPQAGLAVGLMLIVTEDPSLAPIHQVVLTVVLSVVLLNEIVGPVLARWAIARSGDALMDRPRVLDFLHEEHIVTNLAATSMDEVIAELADHLVRTCRLSVDRPALVRGVLERERTASTCLGEGLAVPHTRLPAGDSIAGVIGISPVGIRAATPDGIPLHCVVLLATPEGEGDRHLRVLAALARVVGARPEFRTALFRAETPAHAHALLHAEATARDFNSFLDED